MNTTINISLPKTMYTDAKKALGKRGYASISELIRDALRDWLYPTRITENGFTPEFEARVLRSAAQPRDQDTVLETKEDIRNFFLHLKKPPKKNKRS